MYHTLTYLQVIAGLERLDVKQPDLTKPERIEIYLKSDGTLLVIYKRGLGENKVRMIQSLELTPRQLYILSLFNDYDGDTVFSRLERAFTGVCFEKHEHKF